MIRRYFSCLYVFISMLLLVGCWDYRPLENLSFAVALGIDKTQNEYQITAQFVNPGEVNSKNTTSRTEVVTYQGKGPTLERAFNQLSLHVPHYIFFYSVKIVVLGNEVAHNGISNVLDFLYRFPDMREDYAIIVAHHQKAIDILKVTTNLTKVPAEKLAFILEKINTKKGITIGTQSNFYEFMTKIISKQVGTVLSGFKVIGNKKEGESESNVESIVPHAKVYPTGLAVFKSDWLQGWLTLQESEGYNYIMGTAHFTSEHVSCSKHKTFTVRIVDAQAQHHPYVRNSTVHTNVHVKVKAHITNMACTMQLSKQNITKLEKKTAHEIEKKMRRVMKKTQRKLHNDIFDFYGTLKRADITSWNKLHKNWDEVFSKMPIHYDIKVKFINIPSNIH
ncbi:Ger(x)C family spore germination protein [Bacillus wiedmannii]|uniref:Ger(x)C family spore germination protein n=1 Tax=Bacillus wiedmannii TaxID=1890302 RepID=UPI000BF07D0B|nr:Ger(x)C family spore germination protein [Bacillus wiedmannii]PEO39958.1 spore gernimation protein [Bacillus wiedmannii]